MQFIRTAVSHALLGFTTIAATVALAPSAAATSAPAPQTVVSGTVLTPKATRTGIRSAAVPTGARVVRIAASKRGTPYRYGATGPNAFDCSGYTGWVYRHVGERLPRTAQAQASATRRIPRSAARPGDLVFFTSGGHVYHVGIYAGHNEIWHAPYPGQRVHEERIWTGSVFFGRVR